MCNFLFLFQGVDCLFLILGFFSLTRFCTSEAAGQCTTQFPIYGKALIGHVFASAPSISPVRCFVRCQREKICQSLNYVTTEHICELNNRTKEAQPQKLITDPARLHLTNGPLMRGWIGSSFIGKNTSNKTIVPYQYGHQINSGSTPCLHHITWPLANLCLTQSLFLFPSIITPGALFSFLSLQSLLVPFPNYQVNLALKSKRVKVKEWSAVQFGWIPQTQEKLSWLAVIWKRKVWSHICGLIDWTFQG